MNKNIRFLLLGHYDHEGDYNLGMSRSVEGALEKRTGGFDRFSIQVWDIDTCEYLGDVTGDISEDLAKQTEFSADDLIIVARPY